MMGPRLQVTSSGFIFERRGASLALLQCPLKLAPLAELEYLREIEPRGKGRIVSVSRQSEAGRALHVFVIDEGAAEREVRFDVGPALLGQLRRVEETLGLVVYALAGASAVGAMVYAMMRLMD
jgi:hypothetical protein